MLINVMVFKKLNLFRDRLAPHGSFRANVLTLLTGTTIAQAIPVAITPVLTRLYTPQDFGIFALYLAVASLVSIISTGRYELAVMLPKKDEDAMNVLALSIIIACFISVITFIIVLVMHGFITRLFNIPELSIWLYFIPVTILLTGIYNTLNYWTNRKKQFKRLAISRISLAATTAVISLAMGFSGLGKSGLIVGGIVGQGMATAVLCWQVWQDDHARRNDISKSIMIEKAIEYQDFPKINSLHAFADIVQLSGVTFLLSAFFGQAVLGFYSFSMRILNAPLGLIGSSISQVFYQKASETYSSGGDLHKLTRNTMMRLGLLALPIFAFLIIFSPDIFAFLFGENWREAGHYARILAPWVFFTFLISPISQIPIILNQQRTVFMISLCGNLLILAAILYGGYIAQDVKKGFWMLSLLLSGYFMCVIAWYNKITQKKGMYHV